MERNIQVAQIGAGWGDRGRHNLLILGKAGFFFENNVIGIILLFMPTEIYLYVCKYKISAKVILKCQTYLKKLIVIF